MILPPVEHGVMLYAAMTLWLLIIVLSAWGVHHLWSTLAKPRVVNILLLPGTLAAQLGHVLGLLVTGGTVNNTTLYKDDETGAPEQTADPKSRVPVIGPIMVAMLPILACAGAIYFAARFLGGALVLEMTSQPVSQSLPLSLGQFWEMLRNLITLAENTLDAALGSNLLDWHVALLVYLLVCFTVRMAPFPGNLRGSLGAILSLGILVAILGKLSPAVENGVRNSWPILSLSVGTLLVLLIFSSLVRGGVGLFRLVAKKS